MTTNESDLFRAMLAELNRVHPVSPSGLAQQCPTCNVIMEAEKRLALEPSDRRPRQAYVTRLCLVCDAPVPDEWEANLCAKCQL